MRSKIIIAGIAVFAVILFYFLQKVQSEPILFIKNPISFLKEQSILSKQEEFGLPVRLKIPSINIDANIEYIGIAPDGAMDVPKNPDDTAWFKLGQRPGEKGSAVIAGHYGWKNGKAAAFDNLYQLRKGDKLYIEDDEGTSISFIVRESQRYDPGADASSVFNSSDGKSHLNLITCEGDWNKDQKSYSKRLVVFTDKE
jgi:LPXTG-site transpeptidase (sortase) family protein